MTDDRTRDRANDVRMLYEVRNEFGQVIALTSTRWTAERLIDGIKATYRFGSWTIVKRPEGDNDCL